MMTPAARPPSPLDPIILAAILVFTLASAFGINSYYYGSGDNAITIPFLKQSVDPALYPGDYLLAQRPFYYTYLWNALGLLHARLGMSLPVLFLGAYLVALYLTFLGLYLIALALFENREVAVLSLLFLLFARSTLADVQTIEPTLNTRGVATPLLLFAIYYFLKGSTLRSFLLLGLAYLIHPLTTHYVLAMLVAAALVASGRRGFRQLLVGLPVFLVVASPLLAWRLRHKPPSLHLFSADPEWLVALHYRSAHHMFPFTWGWTTLVHVVVILLLFGIAWRHRDPEQENRHRVISISGWTILGLCVIGLVGSELYPMGVVFVLQPLRSFQFMEYFAMLYVAHYLYRRMTSSGRLVTALGMAGIAGGIAYGGARFALQLVVLISIIAFMAVRLVWRRGLAGRALVMTATGLACLAAGASYAIDRWNGEETFSLVSDEEPLWLDVERWAQRHTDVRDGFIVPPVRELEFRVDGERTVYADFEDGGLMNSNPEFGREWLRRMRMLGFAHPRGGEDFCKLEIAQVRGVAREMEAANRHVFLVWPCADRALPFPERYRNDAYVVYEVGRGAR